MKTLQDDKLLTVKDVSTRLNTSESTVRYWIRNGLITHIALPVSTGKPAYRVWSSTVRKLEERKV